MRLTPDEYALRVAEGGRVSTFSFEILDRPKWSLLDDGITLWRRKEPGGVAVYELRHAEGRVTRSETLGAVSGLTRPELLITMARGWAVRTEHAEGELLQIVTHPFLTLCFADEPASELLFTQEFRREIGTPDLWQVGASTRASCALGEMKGKIGERKGDLITVITESMNPKRQEPRGKRYRISTGQRYLPPWNAIPSTVRLADLEDEVR